MKRKVTVFLTYVIVFLLSPILSFAEVDNYIFKEDDSILLVEQDSNEIINMDSVTSDKTEVEVVYLRIGCQKQKIRDITIGESRPESIQKGDLEIRLPEGFSWSDIPTVKVTKGNLKIDGGNIEIIDGKGNDATLVIPIDTDSREASTITISNITVDLNRMVPEGLFEYEIGGDAVVKNYGDNYGEGKFNTGYITKVKFANVVTPNVDDLARGVVSAQKVIFTVGSTEYTVGEEIATADAVPYINDGHIMIPVKYAASALGVDPSNIKWSEEAKTVTIFGERVIQVKIGSKRLIVNGSAVIMDVEADVIDGRIYLPISWIASALNVPYNWDDTTKTVTFNK